MRITELNDNSVVRRIHALQKLRDDIKAAGQRFGSDSVVTQRIFSGNAYDIEVTDVQFNNRVVEVVFTPSNTADTSTSLVYKMKFTTTSSGYVDSSWVERLKPVNGVQKWRLYLSGNQPPYQAAWWRAKFYFYASGSGTFTATLI